MPALTPVDRSRCYFHLGYGSGAGIPAMDVARLEEAMDVVRDSYQHSRIREILDWCDLAYKDISPELGLGGGNRVMTQEFISGDINRSVSRTMPYQGYLQALQVYHNYTDLLAQELWVPNYRREEQLRYRYERSGGEHINLIPGVADTSTASNAVNHTMLGMGFGMSYMFP